MSDDHQPSTDQLLEHNAAYAADFPHGDLPGTPTRGLAVVACMDSRIDVHAVLGLGNGEAHVIRNGGGVVTDDVIRSLCLSQRYLGTREIVLIHHTDCGLQKVTEDGVKSDLEQEVGIKPEWAVESFGDAHADVRQSIRRIRLTPFVPHDVHLRGFVYDVTTGLLDEVVADG